MPKTIVVTAPSTVVVGNGDTVIIDIEGGGEVTILAESASVRRFRIEYAGDDEADTAVVDLSTFSNSTLHIDVLDYDESDSLILQDTITTGVNPNSNDEYDFTYLGADGNVYEGFVRLKDVGERDFTTQPPPIVICFTDGVVIDTDLGPSPVESLRVGDFVKTLDNGLQPIRWLGVREISHADMVADPGLAPVTIRAGSLGSGLPFTDLTVSPQHRIWVSDWRAELLFGQKEVLAPARSLVDGVDIFVDAKGPVTYRHILFDQHEIIRSNGVYSESLHPGEIALSAIGQMGSEFRGLPKLQRGGHTLSRPALKAYEGRALSKWNVA